MKLTAYFKGDRVQLNGNVQIKYGGLFHEGIYLDGHKQGEKVWLSHKNAEPYLTPIASHICIVSNESEDAK